MKKEEQERYEALRRLRPELFADRSPDCYPLLPGGAVRFENPHLLLLDDRVQTPSGGPTSYLRIVSPPSGACGAAILPFRQGKVILLDHPRHALGRRLLEVPRGFGEIGETAEQCATRELGEELGVAPCHLHALGPLHPDSGLLAMEVMLFAAEVPREGWATEAGVEASCFDGWELEAAIRDGVVADAFTIACFFRAKLRGLI